MFELVKKLTDASGVSGNEVEIRDIIKNEINGFCDEIQTDILGNLIAVKKGSRKKIMLAAHMDEIGLIITHIDDKGFLRFSVIGGVSQYYSLGQRVVFKNGTRGVISYEKKLEDMKNLKPANMFIDIGADGNQEAGKKVRIGDIACFCGEAKQLDEKIVAKALDDRAGCAVLVSLIKTLPQTDNEIYFVFTVQEEVGLRGAKTASYSITPDIAVAVDVTATGDTPGCEVMEVACGKGPAIKIKDNSVICHPEVKKLLEESAKSAGVPYQFEILEKGGTDAGAIHLQAGGIPSGGLSIPCRHVHSPSEIVDLADLENAVKLLCEFVSK